ncbi:hypothetical protein ACFQ45_10660 [Rhodanobacter aciditrophus]|uniref:Uncharacterized protein n=1 Tax=Rhodanobacter aciditrophus TaxID=1623218 RepID=A0ABW4B2Q8_9GAMM
MTALIVVFIVVSLMGSALWVMPSKREREKMELRMLARKLGITVKLTSVNLPDKWDKVTEPKKVCAYHLYREKPLKEFTEINIYPYEVWKHPELCKGWVSSKTIDLSREVQAKLEKHHGVWVALEVTSDRVSLFWNEKGDASAVHDACEVMADLLALR